MKFIKRAFGEMTTREKFCLSYDPLKVDFIAFKMDDISSRKSVMLRLHAKVLLHVLLYDFYDTTLSTE